MVKTINDMGNRQPDSNAGCSKQKEVADDVINWVHGKVFV